MKNKMEHFYQDVRGMMDYEDLYSEMVKHFSYGTFVELGTWLGRSAAYMNVEIFNSGKEINFFTIDNFAKCDERAKNMREQFKFFNVIKSDTAEAAKFFKDHSVDFIFIDADHSYEGVQRDIKAWLPKLKYDGIMAGHDYYNDRYPDLVNAVQELLPVTRTSKMCWIYRNMQYVYKENESQ